MATCSSILAWKIPWTVKPGRLQSMGLQKSQTQLSEHTHTHTHTHTDKNSASSETESVAGSPHQYKW